MLKYTWQHKCPENHSALTYWEEDIPSRIDLGKMKYGGPFTNEEVEDTKTFFHILFLLTSLCGFHLADNGFSVMKHLQYSLCPSRAVSAVLAMSPNTLTALTAVTGVPILQYVLLPHLRRYVPNMLHRLGLGVALMLIQEAVGIIIALDDWEVNGSCHISYSSHPLGDCLLYNFKVFFTNGTCRYLKKNNYQYCGTGNELFLSLLLPILLHSFSYLLVFMTALEFICAQAPLRLKGMLVGFWYATSALQYLVVVPSEIYTREDTSWFIFHGVKTLLILLSFLLYCCMAKHYHYRQRDEVVPIHFMVEEKYEREFDLAEEYEREQDEERRTLFVCSNTSSYQSTRTNTS